MYRTHHYKIEFEKVKSLEDVIRILKAMDPSFEDNGELEDIKDLVKIVKKEGGRAVMD